jgi:hypothetical protein
MTITVADLNLARVKNSLKKRYRIVVFRSFSDDFTLFSIEKRLNLIENRENEIFKKSRAVARGQRLGPMAVEGS